MIRVALFLVLIVIFALAAVWLADRPGDVAITWQGMRIETSVMVAAVALATLIAVAIALWALLRGLMRAPTRMSTSLGERRRRRGFNAISRGLVAIGAGDARAAHRFAAEALRNTPGEPLALLLTAQTAQLNGDRGAAEAAFRAMAARPDTRLLALHGLYVEAQRRHDTAAARQFAEEAAQAAPALPWAGEAVLEFRCAAADWDGALECLEANRASGLLDKPAHRRLRAVLLTARAMAAHEHDRDRAKTLAIEAARLAPDLVPAAVLAGRLLAESGEPRKAGKIIETAWRANPHPDLADAYAHVRISDSARDRLKRIQSLVRQPEGHLEGALALARAALDARELGVARAALAPLIAAPTQRVAMLMAELEELTGDAGRAREWMGRALHARHDPAWTADGFVSERWMPVSPVSGRLDAFQWKVPVEEVVVEAGMIEGHAAPAIGSSPPPAPEPPPQEPPAAPPPRVPNLRRDEPEPQAPIIPLVHAPDDPGPEAERETEDEREPHDDGWRRLTAIFRS
ncbi:MAG: heme biosynthesis protein HemY [Hyphomicrobiales bacterium]|nr:heme biosynthesis protein HemY [Hyphomicrobiales bacterium]MBV8825745.1 heme biosynthesis protein HemY [Hyphomicrobiales bacterium]MBV9428501.1 heme biosynthesis protein HemY [Bradyrhizobiaceae bacterium]